MLEYIRYIMRKNSTFIKNRLKVSEIEPGILPVLPLRDLVVFPHTSHSFLVGRRKSLSAISAASDKKLVILSTQNSGDVEDPNVEDLNKIGVLAEITSMSPMAEESIRVSVTAICRVKIEDFQMNSSFISAEWTLLPYDNENLSKIELLMMMAKETFGRMVESTNEVLADFLTDINEIEDVERLIGTIAHHLHMNTTQYQTLLEMNKNVDRLEMVIARMVTEQEMLNIEKRIHEKVRHEMEESQKQYYLREKLRAIRTELGDGEDHGSEIDELKAKIEEAGMPEEAKEKALKELWRLERMPSASPEVTVTRNYIDWLLSMPWNKRCEEKLDLGVAEDILNADHWGLQKVKERILEYLAVRKLNPKMKGPILCFVGPPGVGKTSIGKSIARALGRQFVRISLGGVRDESEIRGHRRTYVGALPGRIVQGMKTAGQKNPVFMMDEVDKIGQDFRGDPSSALLEVLDPEQNYSFSDHYLEVPLDLSEVIFITTANQLDPIPDPLLDRTEVIEFPGYTEDDKLNIALKFLVPKQLKEHGLTDKNCKIGEDTVKEIIRRYTREAGVRNLEREIAGVFRKVAKQIASGNRRSMTVKPKDLHGLIGAAKYRYGMAGEKDEIGMATGLGWTPAGGDILNIEVSLMHGKGNLQLTGQLGDVMQESAKAAMSYARTNADTLGIPREKFTELDIHIHVPAGGIPKDGPSAGITLATALISALTGRAVKRTVAMTGEVTLRGLVLPVGGIKNKMLAAHRAGITDIILPEDNRKDLEELPDYVMKELNFHFVDRMPAVLEIALREAVK